MPRETNIQIRRGTAADWSSVNPTLAAGEIAMESDTRKIKVGDGSTAWNSLQYVRLDGGDLNEGALVPDTLNLLVDHENNAILSQLYEFIVY